MAKVYLPLQSVAASGKMASTISSIVFQRTGGSDSDPYKQVTYVKMRVVPYNPNSLLQQAQRELFKGVMKSGLFLKRKALKDAVKKG